MRKVKFRLRTHHPQDTQNVNIASMPALTRNKTHPRVILSLVIFGSSLKLGQSLAYFSLTLVGRGGADSNSKGFTAQA